MPGASNPGEQRDHCTLRPEPRPHLPAACGEMYVPHTPATAAYSAEKPRNTKKGVAKPLPGEMNCLVALNFHIERP